MDWRIMGTLGAKLDDPNLMAASPAQKARFWPGGDSEDSRVQMFDDIFVLPNMGDGYQGFSRVFSYVQGDGLNWDDVATNGANPDERRSEYVAAYLSLGAGQSVLPILQKPSAGYSSSTSWAQCNGQWDGVNGDPNPSYTCSEANIDAIATAHCSIAANGKPADDLANLQSGNYGAVAPGPCGSTCPSECACKGSANQCVAPWLGDSAAGASSSAASSTSASSTGGVGGSGISTSEASSTGGAGNGGSSASSANSATGAGGAAFGGSGAGGVDVSGTSSSGATATTTGGTVSPRGSGSSCAFGASGSESGSSPSGGVVAFAAAALAVSRRRSRRR
jgi:hypothetical protein